MPEAHVSIFRQPGRFLRQLPARAIVTTIRGYQRALSPLLPAIFGPTCGCRFAPTCSHYAIDAVKTHGARRGSWLAVCRLVKCTPLHSGGFDPVPARDGTRRRCSRVAA
jgi:uncharacterized protein